MSLEYRCVAASGGRGLAALDGMPLHPGFARHSIPVILAGLRVWGLGCTVWGLRSNVLGNMALMQYGTYKTVKTRYGAHKTEHGTYKTVK